MKLRDYRVVRIFLFFYEPLALPNDPLFLRLRKAVITASFFLSTIFLLMAGFILLTNVTAYGLWGGILLPFPVVWTTYFVARYRKEVPTWLVYIWIAPAGTLAGIVLTLGSPTFALLFLPNCIVTVLGFFESGSSFAQFMTSFVGVVAMQVTRSYDLAAEWTQPFQGDGLNVLQLPGVILMVELSWYVVCFFASATIIVFALYERLKLAKSLRWCEALIHQCICVDVHAAERIVAMIHEDAGVDDESSGDGMTDTATAPIPNRAADRAAKVSAGDGELGLLETFDLLVERIRIHRRHLPDYIIKPNVPQSHVLHRKFRDAINALVPDSDMHLDLAVATAGDEQDASPGDGPRGGGLLAAAVHMDTSSRSQGDGSGRGRPPLGPNAASSSRSMEEEEDTVEDDPSPAVGDGGGGGIGHNPLSGPAAPLPLGSPVASKSTLRLGQPSGASTSGAVLVIGDVAAAPDAPSATTSCTTTTVCQVVVRYKEDTRSQSESVRSFLHILADAATTTGGYVSPNLTGGVFTIVWRSTPPPSGDATATAGPPADDSCHRACKFVEMFLCEVPRMDRKGAVLAVACKVATASDALLFVNRDAGQLASFRPKSSSPETPLCWAHSIRLRAQLQGMDPVVQRLFAAHKQRGKLPMLIGLIDEETERSVTASFAARGIATMESSNRTGATSSAENVKMSRGASLVFELLGGRPVDQEAGCNQITAALRLGQSGEAKKGLALLESLPEDQKTTALSVECLRYDLFVASQQKQTKSSRR